MNYYLISIGGTGARCMEAFIHMNAAGFMQDKNATIKVVYVDVDTSMQNLTDTRSLTDTYSEVMSSFSQLNGDFFTNNIEFVDPSNIIWNPMQGLKGVSDSNDLVGVFQKATMQQNDPALAGIFDLMFDQAEQQTNLKEGFRAHPAIGAAVIGSSMNVDQPGIWQTIVQEINNNKNQARIFFFGSVFGGTGASGFPNIARILKEAFQNEPGVKFGGALMLPYFNFKPASDDDKKDENGNTIITPDSITFLPKTFASLDYYLNTELVGRVYDSVYLLGDTEPCDYGDYAPGGAAQNPPAHYLELFAAMAAFDFFNKADGDQCFAPTNNERSFMYQIPGNFLTWQDFPVAYPGCTTEVRLKTMLRMAYFYRTQIHPILSACKDNKSELANNRWIGKFFRKTETTSSLFGFFTNDKQVTDVSEDTVKASEKLDKYFDNLLKWWLDICLTSTRCQKLLKITNIFKVDITKSYKDNREKGNLALKYDFSQSYAANRNSNANNVAIPQEFFAEDQETYLFDDKEHSLAMYLTNSQPGNGTRDFISRLYEISKNGKVIG